MMYSFSEKYITDTKKKLALEVLKLVGINSFDEKKYIIYNDLQSPETLEKIRNMIPALKTVFQISKNRCLSINSWQKSKHPGVNLLRQILKEVGYKLSLINEFQGTVCVENGNKKKIYNTKYIIIPFSCKEDMYNLDSEDMNEYNGQQQEILEQNQNVKQQSPHISQFQMSINYPNPPAQTQPQQNMQNNQPMPPSNHTMNAML